MKGVDDVLCNPAPEALSPFYTQGIEWSLGQNKALKKILTKYMFLDFVPLTYGGGGGGGFLSLKYAFIC